MTGARTDARKHRRSLWNGGARYVNGHQIASVSSRPLPKRSVSQNRGAMRASAFGPQSTAALLDCVNDVTRDFAWAVAAEVPLSKLHAERLRLAPMFTSLLGDAGRNSTIQIAGIRSSDFTSGCGVR